MQQDDKITFKKHRIMGEKPTHSRYRVVFGNLHALDLVDIRNSLRSLMWRNVGIERTGDQLAAAGTLIDFWDRYVLDREGTQPAHWELQNMLTLAGLITRAAALRTNEDENPSVERVLAFGDAVMDHDGVARTEVIRYWMSIVNTMRYVAVDRTIRADDGPFHFFNTRFRPSIRK